MNNERDYSLGYLPKWLRNRASDLEAQIRELEKQEGSPTENNYEEILSLTMSVISIAIELTEALKTIAEDANLQAPDAVAGARLKENLGYSHREKDEIAGIALISARAILNNHNRLVDYLVAKVADTCHEVMKERD